MYKNKEILSAQQYFIMVATRINKATVNFVEYIVKMN
jgi:hypothetical protein